VVPIRLLEMGINRRITLPSRAALLGVLSSLANDTMSTAGADDGITLIDEMMTEDSSREADTKTGAAMIGGRNDKSIRIRRSNKTNNLRGQGTHESQGELAEHIRFATESRAKVKVMETHLLLVCLMKISLCQTMRPTLSRVFRQREVFPRL